MENRGDMGTETKLLNIPDTELVYIGDVLGNPLWVQLSGDVETKQYKLSQLKQFLVLLMSDRGYTWLR